MCLVSLFFFFKQKTAYEMRISDWSSDVCSSDLHGRVLQRAPADAHHRLEHDRQHRRLQPEEQRLDDADITEAGVEPAQTHDGNDAGQDEERTGDEAALRLMQQPADVDGELDRKSTRLNSSH